MCSIRWNTGFDQSRSKLECNANQFRVVLTFVFLNYLSWCVWSGRNALTGLPDCLGRLSKLVRLDVHQNRTRPNEQTYFLATLILLCLETEAKPYSCKGWVYYSKGCWSVTGITQIPPSIAGCIALAELFLGCVFIWFCVIFYLSCLTILIDFAI